MSPQNLRRLLGTKEIVVDVSQLVIQTLQKDEDGVDKDDLPTERLNIAFKGGSKRQDWNDGVNSICQPEGRNHNDTDLNRYIHKLVEVGLLLPLGSIRRKRAPQQPRQENAQEHIEDRNADEIDCEVEDMTLDGWDRVEPHVLHYLDGRLEYTLYVSSSSHVGKALDP